MLAQLFPERIDNDYRGHGLAPWLFALVVLVQAGQGLMSIFNGYYAASSPDAIPLDTYAPAAAQTVVFLHFLPIVRTGTPPGSVVNLVLLAVMIVGLALSLRSPGNDRARE